MTENTEDEAVEAIAGIIVRDVLQEEYDDLVEGYLDEILTASRRIMQLPAYAAVGKLFEKRLDDAITSRDARIEKLEAALREIEDHVGMRVEFAEPKRTEAQNRLLWPLLTALSVQMKWHGLTLSPEDWKDIMTAGLKREARMVPNMDGNGFVALGMRTSTMTKAEFGDLLTLIYAFGAQHAVIFGDEEQESAA